jgi:pimeloyl-ACP methyl ester carboxylesterase
MNMKHICRWVALLLAVLTLNPGGTPTEAAESAASADRPRLSLDALRAKYQDRRGQIANIDGVEVYYKDEGRGPAILMIHGSQSTLRTWDYIAPVLVRSGYRVIRYDLPPQGLSGPVSDAVAAKLTPALLAAKLLDLRQVDTVSCVGVSSGGTTCMYLAATYPERVTRLVMSNSPADPVATGHMVLTKDFEDVQREARETGFQSQRFWNVFLDYFSGDPTRLDTGIREQYYDFNRRVVEKNYTALVGLVADHDKTLAAMASVRAPTLLIWGARDALLPASAAETLAGYLKNAQVSRILLPDVGHYPPLEVPSRFAALLLAYLDAAVPARTERLAPATR